MGRAAAEVTAGHTAVLLPIGFLKAPLVSALRAAHIRAPSRNLSHPPPHITIILEIWAVLSDGRFWQL